MSELYFQFVCRQYTDESNASICTNINNIFALTKQIKNKATALTLVDKLRDIDMDLTIKADIDDNESILSASTKIEECYKSLQQLQTEETTPQPATRTATRNWNPFSSAYTQFTNMGTRRKWWGGTRRRRRTAFKARRLKR